ncbi:pyrrolidone-carboxylate peptidase [Gracilaria domingensis]|nr:pyrrolidone-carboxylate peptidase [Gracilaria domingensis]
MGTVPDYSATLLEQPAIASATADEDSKVTEFHLTGFSRFHNVPSNPTQSIVEALPAYLGSHPLHSGAVLATTNVLKVAAETSRAELETLYKQLDNPTHSTLTLRRRSDRRVIFIHLGVNMRAINFELEHQARNEATFSCPDELGWTPIKRPIDKNNSDVMAVRRTSLCLEKLAEELKRQNFNVQLSTDAGRFVCNWVYYNSLMLAEVRNADSLFVHVPSVSVCPIDQQIRFIAALLDCIATMPYAFA